MTDDRIEVKLWAAIVAAVRDVGAETERAFAADPVDLPGLYRRACLRLDGLRAALEASMPPAEAAALLEPLCMLIDERVLARLGDGSLRRRLEWPLLQRPFHASAFGGDLFFSNLAALEAQSSPPARLVQVYLFCLSEGFVGCCADEPARIAAHRDRLWALLGPREWPHASPLPSAPTPAPFAAWQQVALALALVVAWQGLWWALGGRA